MSKIGQYYFDLTQSSIEQNRMYNNGDTETFFDENLIYNRESSDDNQTDDIPF